MTIKQPQGSDPLSSPDHALSHRVFANDDSAPVKSVVVDSVGRVGIGNPNPTQPLDINGNANVTGTITSPTITSLQALAIAYAIAL